MTYEKLPAQTRYDVDEMVNAYYRGGKKLAARTFRALARCQ